MIISKHHIYSQSELDCLLSHIDPLDLCFLFLIKELQLKRFVRVISSTHCKWIFKINASLNLEFVYSWVSDYSTNCAHLILSRPFFYSHFFHQKESMLERHRHTGYLPNFLHGNMMCVIANMKELLREFLLLHFINHHMKEEVTHMQTVYFKCKWFVTSFPSAAVKSASVGEGWSILLWKLLLDSEYFFDLTCDEITVEWKRLTGNLQIIA